MFKKMSFEIQILDKYFISTFIKNFLGGLMLMVGIALIAKIMETLENMMKYDGPTIEIFKFYIYYLPNFFMFLIPPAFLFATSFTVAFFTKYNELSVVMAAGRSMQRVLFPVFLLSLFIGTGFFFFNEYVAFPYSHKAFMQLAMIGGRSKDYRLRDRLNFSTRAGARYYHIGAFYAKDRVIVNLHLVQMNKERQISSITTAQKAVIAPHNWQLYFATQTLFDETGAYKSRKSFATLKLDLPESRDYFLKPMKDFDETNVFDLKKYITLKKSRGEPYLKYVTEYYWHFSYPCIMIFVAIIGGLVGSFLKKGALASSITLSLLFSTFYYFTMFFSKSLGNIGIVSPWLSAWVTNFIFAIICIYLIYKFRK